MKSELVELKLKVDLIYLWYKCHIGSNRDYGNVNLFF